MPDGTKPAPGGWNRIHLIVADTAAEVDQLRAAEVTFRNDIVVGPGGQRLLLEDPSSNVVELSNPPADERGTAPALIARHIATRELHGHRTCLAPRT